MSAYNKDPKSLSAPPQLRGRPTHAVDASLQEIVRAYIRAANLEGAHITLETIQDYIKEKRPEEGSFHLSTLTRT